MKSAEAFLEKFSQDCYTPEARQGEALAMLLKRMFLFLVDELELLATDQFKSLLQTKDLTSVDPKKFFEDFLKNQSDLLSSETVFSKLSKLNTLFYILCEWEKIEIDTKNIFLQSQESKQNIKELVEIMSKLNQKDLEELIEANNDVIGTFNYYFF